MAAQYQRYSDIFRGFESRRNFHRNGPDKPGISHPEGSKVVVNNLSVNHSSPESGQAKAGRKPVQPINRAVDDTE